MKLAKASEKDIDAAGAALSVLNEISSGYYPSNNNEEDDPTFFDPDDKKHLRHFYDSINATLDKSPGWPMRIIGGMCYVILYDTNEIVDPNADTLEMHPKIIAALKNVDELTQAKVRYEFMRKLSPPQFHKIFMLNFQKDIHFDEHIDSLIAKENNEKYSTQQ